MVSTIRSLGFAYGSLALGLALVTRPSWVSGEELLMFRVRRSKYEAGTVAAHRQSAEPPQRLPAEYSVAAPSYDRKWRFLHNRLPEQRTGRFELFDSYVIVYTAKMM